jgi:polyisoprenoid-binding protein YceI
MTFFNDSAEMIRPATAANRHRSSRGNGRILLDKAWAHELGVHRTSGSYRIGRRELAARLQRYDQDQLAFREWEIDPAHTNVSFITKYLMISKVRGGFRDFAGTFRVGDVPEDSQVEITIDAASIDTGLPLRDNHLRSPDFLDVRNHPHLWFRSTSLEREDQRRFKMTGDLTIRGITRPVTLDLHYLGAAEDPCGTPKVAFEAKAQINREDFGLTWNRALEGGGILVDRQVSLEIEAQAVPKPRVPAA